jgi:ATP-dependent RNA helicase DeaD
MTNVQSFHDLSLSDDLLKAIQEKGYDSPTPIQKAIIPLFLSTEKNIIGQAQTGTGKTASFALPLLQKINTNIPQTQAIILAPTRELAMQVSREIESFHVKDAPRMALLYGGQNMRDELIVLKRVPHIVVGTPGRVRHHLRKQTLLLENVRFFILDEADEMLNFGFREEIEDILQNTPHQKRVLLFSATMPRAIIDIVHKYIGEYELVSTIQKQDKMATTNVSQHFYCMHARDKFDGLCRIIEMEDRFYAIVFCRTKIETDLVASQLRAKLYHAESIHGDIEQAQREKTLSRFREGKTNILVATDVAARGIDIENLDFVINFSLPENHEIYTHRIGRTGRAGKMGKAITLVPPHEIRKIRFFEQKTGFTIERKTLPEVSSIIKKRQEHLIMRTEDLLKKDSFQHLSPLVKKLLALAPAEQVLSALIKDAYQDDFDPSSYPYIEETFREPSSAPRSGERKSFFGKERSYNKERRGGGGKGFSGGENKFRKDWKRGK